LDCRPKINAHANAIQGKGFENVASLGGAEGATLVFADIHNIHVMRESLQKVRDTNGNTDSDESGGNSAAVSKWLHHVAAVLRGAASTAESLHMEYPVLVHCSDGWDRTAQISALSQLLLDPHYRTIDGFLMLIEKEWIGFGFQFEERMGRMSDKGTSPVFIQYLDCVWQLLNQYPTEFEFSSGLLEVLMFCAFSGFFSSFRTNCERQRIEELTRHAESSLNTSIGIVHFSSVFTYIHILLASSMGPLLINPKYKHPGVTVKYLHPRCGVEDLTLWTQGLLPRGFSSFSQGGGRTVLSRVECDALSSNAHARLLKQWVTQLKHNQQLDFGCSLDIINGQHHGTLLSVQLPHDHISKYRKHVPQMCCDVSNYVQVKDNHKFINATIRIQLFIRARLALRMALQERGIINLSESNQQVASSLVSLFCQVKLKGCLASHVMKKQLALSIIYDTIENVIETCEEMQRTCPELICYEESTTRGTIVAHDRDRDSDFGDNDDMASAEMTKTRQSSVGSGNGVGGKTGKPKPSISSTFFSKIGFNSSKKDRSKSS